MNSWCSVGAECANVVDVGSTRVVITDPDAERGCKSVEIDEILKLQKNAAFAVRISLCSTFEKITVVRRGGTGF